MSWTSHKSCREDILTSQSCCLLWAAVYRHLQDFKVIFTEHVVPWETELMLIVAAEHAVWSLTLFLRGKTINVTHTLRCIQVPTIVLTEILGKMIDGDLPLKSWYIPGTMMIMMANSLLNVRKICSLAVHVTLILFRYITVAREKKN